MALTERLAFVMGPDDEERRLIADRRDVITGTNLANLSGSPDPKKLSRRLRRIPGK